MISTRVQLMSLSSGFPIAGEYGGGKVQLFSMKTGDSPTPKPGAASLATHTETHSFHLKLLNQTGHISIPFIFFAILVANFIDQEFTYF